MVSIESLSFGYGPRALFQDLALGLAPGNIYGLLGVNGAGKSTLLKLLAVRYPSVIRCFAIRAPRSASVTTTPASKSTIPPDCPSPSKSSLRRVIAEALSPERLFVISTHQVRDLGTLMDPLVVLHEGRVLLNRTLAEIATRLHMRQQPSPPPADQPGLLFSEPAVGGFWSVWRGGGDGPIDLEVLFNAVTARPDVAQRLFAATGGAA